MKLIINALGERFTILSLRKLMNWLRRISTSFLFLVAGKTGFAKLPRNKKHVHRTVHLFTTAPRERKGSAQPIPLSYVPV